MPRIRILSDTLVSQIAAGEVVERPASVLKELIENALDAGAGALEVELEGGGARRIRVADDGAGMDRDDALLAFDRHATSKIADFADLERVATLGFRGEALASIAAVSKVDLTTATAPGDGTRVRIEGGRVLAAEPAARARGTTIEVRSLFWNVPARRKFLKTQPTELRRCLEVAEGYALARPDVALRVRHEGRLLLEAPALGEGVAGLRARVAQVFGPRLESELVELAGAGTRGLLGTPATSRGRRSFVFVNRRLVRDRALLAAFYRAVREEWRSDEFPSLFLFLDLPPEQVDVNVHPQKAEVRFRDGGFVGRVGDELRRALGRARREEPAPLRAASGKLAAPPAWEGLGGRTAAGDVRETHAGARDEYGFVQVQDQGQGKDVRLGGADPGVAAGELGGGAASVEGGSASAGSGVTSAAGGVTSAGGAFPVDATPSQPRARQGAGPGGEGAGGSASAPGGLPVRGSLSSVEWWGGSSVVGRELGRIAVPTLAPLARNPLSVPLSGRSGAVRPFRLLGQYKGTLILLEGPDGLYLLDQHVAHERILYERLRRALGAERPAGQRLVTPLLLELSRAETMRLAALAPALADAGFELEELSGGTLALSSTPSALGPEEARGLLLALATDGEATAENLRRRLLDDLAASTACKAAVKMHHPLSAEKLEALVSELFQAENPYACPHGRPVVLVLGDADLERRFGRR